jgi:glycosyltransferase involved in cell wall biosynthesis
MNILLLTQVLPYPPDSGPKVKTWYVIKYLAQHHDLTLVSFVRGDQTQSVRVLEQYCRGVYTVPMQRSKLWEAVSMLKSLSSGLPFLMVRDDRAAMRRLVDRLSVENRFDIAHADQLNMAQYARRVKGARKILDAHNALWLLYQRLCQTMPPGAQKTLLDRDWRLIKHYEGRVCREFDGVLAVSSEDRVALEEAAGGQLNVQVVPIAIDTDEIQPAERQASADHILHMGTMFWPPNVDGVLWFLREVLPLLRATRPGVVFDIVGANPPAEIRAYGESDPGICVAGYVENPLPYLRQAGAVVVPLRAGGGMRVKILNALAQALPVVSTTLGSEGIAVESGKHLLIADTPQEFASAVLRFLEDRRLADELGRNGRAQMVAHYDYRATGLLIDEVYQRKS